MVLHLLLSSEFARTAIRFAARVLGKHLMLMNLPILIHQGHASMTFELLPAMVIEQTHPAKLPQNRIGNCIQYRAGSPPSIHIVATETPAEDIFSVAYNRIRIDVLDAGQVSTLLRRVHGVESSRRGRELALSQRMVDSSGRRTGAEPGEAKTRSFPLRYSQRGWRNAAREGRDYAG